ncbi:unnamed protein product [Heligmosomoides polygyrus]|uniref:EF-hand domain-containing protein n=1 Tax=Heligmosomoides polygyrus TaxID=6339 RepID=A0A3P7XAC0_HELPZ|nr:unnamed protein product [Heligmosomoides polygyrus]
MCGIKCAENDLNRNGGLNFREFSFFALNLMNLERAELEKLFLAGDLDRNSELDGDECIPVRKMLKSVLRDKSELMLKKYDVNGDRNLSREEVDELAMKEFGVPVQSAFVLSDQNRDHAISAGDEMSELLLNLRTQELVDARLRLSKFDTNNDGKVSYEEIKPEVLRTADGFTLKQVFKAVDMDKDFYLSAQEYLALLNELGVRQRAGSLTGSPRTIDMASASATPNKVLKRFERVSSTTAETADTTDTSTSPSTSEAPLSTSDTQESTVETTVETTSLSSASSTAVAHAEIMIRDKRAVERVDAAPLIEEKLYGSGRSGSKRTLGVVQASSGRRSKREDATAPPLNKNQMELKKEEMDKLAETVKHNLRGGGGGPSIDLAVTVPYDSKDFE